MKRAKRQNRNILEKDLSVDKFIGIDTFSPHADLQKGEFRSLDNFDIYGNYIKTRRGSETLLDDLCPNLDILNYVIYDAGDKEYMIIQQDNDTTSNMIFVELTDGAGWQDVLNKSDYTPYIPASTVKFDMSVSNDKIYLFSAEAGNSIIEFETSTEKFLRRKMGLPAPQIHSVEGVEDETGINGKHVYGVELVFKDTTVTPNVDIIVSGPNRALQVDNPSFKEGKLAIGNDGPYNYYTIAVDATLNDGTLITAPENDNWTHARLYRSKDLTSATNDAANEDTNSEIVGRADELFQIEEMTKAEFLATLVGDYYYFSDDYMLDDDVPFPLDVVTGSRLDLYPVPPASIGVFHRNRIWCSGVTNFPGPSGDLTLESIESKIFYTSEADTQYSESVSAIGFIESDPGDGQDMIKLLPFRDDLIGIKSGKTGRVINGDPLSGWVTEDSVIGIKNFGDAQYIPSVGIAAKVNDQDDLKIFGYDLQWRSFLYDIQISRPIRNIIKDFSSDDLQFIYTNGKLIISGGSTGTGSSECLVLHTEQQQGWSTYSYPFNIESMFTYNDGRDVCVLAAGQPPISIEVDDQTSDYNFNTNADSDIQWEIITHKFQENSGRSLIEQRSLSIVADLLHQMTYTAYVNGKLWDVPFEMLLNPEDYPDSNLKETEYRGWSMPKPLGNYLHYKITGYSTSTIYSIMVNALIQSGQIPVTFDPFEVLDDATTVPDWANPNTTVIIETGTATNVITETGTATDTITEIGNS